MSTRLERIMYIDALIRQRNYPSINTFRNRFEVSERTIHDDLSFLRDRLSAPIQYDRFHRGYVYTDETWGLPAMMASEGELLAFFLSLELSSRYLGTSFEEPLRSTIQRLIQALPIEHHIELQDLAKHYTFQSGAVASTNADLLTLLHQAINERYRVKIVYFTASRGERNERIIEPYHLYNVRGDWQIIAFDHLRHQTRNFAVSRIENWEVLWNERFTPDPTFSAQTYLDTGFLAERGDQVIDISIWFDSYQATYMRNRIWHPSQTIEEHSDGSLSLHFQNGALAEIKRWVMSFGPHAVVLQPQSLIDEIRSELQASLEIYENR